MKTGAMRDGILVAWVYKIILDGGAYADDTLRWLALPW